MNYNEYLYLFIYAYLSFAIVLALLVGAYVASRKPPLINDSASAFECGFDPFKDSYDGVDTHFFLIGLLFIIFDLELIFIYPWALNFFYLSYLEFFCMLFFLIIVNSAFIFEWLVDALEWTAHI